MSEIAISSPALNPFSLARLMIPEFSLWRSFQPFATSTILRRIRGHGFTLETCEPLIAHCMTADTRRNNSLKSRFEHSSSAGNERPGGKLTF
jgi:hypothetical protein